MTASPCDIDAPGIDATGTDPATVAVAVSGGVDSLAALARLAKARGRPDLAPDLGLEPGSSVERVLAVHALFTPESSPHDPRLALLAQACAALGVPLAVLDLRAEFARLVMEPFAAAYAGGLTPNPCVGCNRDVKFGLLLDEARRLGCARLATGHYASVSGAAGARRLGRAAHLPKDQSYFLSLLQPRAAEAALFPLAAWTKDQARALVRELGLRLPEPKESQDVCFIPDNDYQSFLAARFGLADAPGPMTDRQGRILGRHRGLWRYTVGQRRGLGVSAPHPLYVLAKERGKAQDRLVLGPKAELLRLEALAGQVRLWRPDLSPETPCLAKLGYRSPLTPATLALAPDARAMRLHFASPVQAGAPGQIACAYDEDGRVLAAGVILA